MLYALKVMTYHSGEQKRKEKFLYREDSAIIISIEDQHHAGHLQKECVIASYFLVGNYLLKRT